jgi:predicted outer membrane protein
MERGHPHDERGPRHAAPLEPEGDRDGQAGPAQRDLADTVIEDDTSADKKIVALASEEHIDLDASTAPPNPTDVSSLEGVVDFDATFAKVLHDDQERELAHASAAYDGTRDPRLRFLLGELIPQMRAHRDMAKLILDEGAPRASL